MLEREGCLCDIEMVVCVIEGEGVCVIEREMLLCVIEGVGCLCARERGLFVC